MSNCKHDLPEHLCMVCVTTSAAQGSYVAGGNDFDSEIQKAMEEIARLDPPDADRKQPTWCIGCKDHTGRLGKIEQVFVGWKCDTCNLTWLTVRTTDDTVGNCIAAHIIAIRGRKVA